MSKSKRAPPREVTPVVNWTGVQAQRAEYAPGTIIVGQGDPAPSIMYVEKGAVRLSVLSHSGKEAVVAMLDPGHFSGEGCFRGRRKDGDATAMIACTVLTVEKPEMVHQLRARPDFADRFLSHMLTRNICIEVWSTNSTPQRSVWRARYCCWHDTVSHKPLTAPSPKVSQELLAEMVGTTRSRVNFFMNKFRKPGFIDYNGALKINSSWSTQESEPRPRVDDAVRAKRDGRRSLNVCHSAEAST